MSGGRRITIYLGSFKYVNICTFLNKYADNRSYVRNSDVDIIVTHTRTHARTHARTNERTHERTNAHTHMLANLVTYFACAL